MKLICRLCAKLNFMHQLVDLNDPYHNLKIILEKCCQLRISDDDKLPNRVCKDCANILKVFWNFYNLVHKSQTILKISLGLDQAEKETDSVASYLKDAKSMLKKDNFQYHLVDFDSLILETEYDEEINEEIVDVDYNGMELKSKIQQNSGSDQLDTTDAIEDESKWIEVIVDSDIGEDEIVNNDDENLLKDNEENSNQNELFKDMETIETIEYDENLDNEGASIIAKDVIDVNNSECSTWQNYVWRCFICKNICESLPELTQHYYSSHKNQDMKFVCCDCHKPYAKYNTFINHVKSVHRPELKFCCDVCNTVFPNFELLANHRSNKCNNDQYPFLDLCTQCYKGFLNEGSRSVHSSIHSSKIKRKKFKCNDCGKEFATKPNLRAHSKIHSGIKDYVCDFCGKGFVQKANMEEHLVTHKEITPYECDICNKEFKTPGRLTKHKTVHTGVKPFRCKECNKEFRSRDTLQVHTRVHSNSFPYECETCLKRFRFRSVLVTHRHQHTGVRPYSCEPCDHHFTNWPNYNKHMKRRHGIDTSSNSRKAARAAESFSSKTATTSTASKSVSTSKSIQLPIANSTKANLNDKAKEQPLDNIRKTTLSKSATKAVINRSGQPVEVNKATVYSDEIIYNVTVCGDDDDGDEDEDAKRNLSANDGNDIELFLMQDEKEDVTYPKKVSSIDIMEGLHELTSTVSIPNILRHNPKP